ncbi:site-specific integrase [Halovibrio sp. HP20-50]|uniref:site-specific integrase n=1 Tax=Halovibrio sp. HP20-59 TaxID=3080275 RepID=UPI00294ADD3F|nr:site-specific integrase [Halovibrio sp. HP20-59]MEA2119754.1 site-specific integrase [Halovibrio sp. HP20-59]
MPPRYLVKRNDIYYFRIRVPQDLSAFFQQREIKVSTKTKDPLLATSRASMIAAFVFLHLHQLRQGAHNVNSHDKDFEDRGRRGYTSIKMGDYEFTSDFGDDSAKEMEQIKQTLALLQQSGLLNSATQTPSLDTADVGIATAFSSLGSGNSNSEKLISTLFDEYFSYCTDKRNRGWSDATIADYQDTKGLYIEYLGVDKPLQQITLTEHTSFRDALMKLPSNRSKKVDFKGRSVAQLLGMNVPKEHLMSRTTINNHLTRLNSFYRWLSNKQLTSLPNLDKLGDKSGKKASELRAVFNKADLHRIFSDEKFTQHNHKHDYYFWIPLLALYTGCRLRELCQLAPEDVKMDDETDILYLDINDETSSAMKQLGFKKSLKTTTSRRHVPIHPHLLQLGFRNFVNEAIESGKATLFTLKPGTDGDAGVYVSKWFQRFRKQIRLESTGAKKDFHSFRHTFINALEECDVHPDVNRDIVGHSHEDTNRSTYRKSAALRKLYHAICKIDFGDALSRVKHYEKVAVWKHD